MSTRIKIILSCVIFVILFISTSIYLIIPKAYIKFDTAPHQVFMLIDNKDEKSINSGDTIGIAPGKHTITVFRDEFNPYIKDINIGNGKSEDFVVALTGLTDKAKKILVDKDLDATIGRFGDEMMAEQSDFISNIYPIMQVLPIQARLYSITSCPSVKYPVNQPLRVAICVDASQDDLGPYVQKDITWRGYNPNDYEIITTVTPNPI